MDENELRQLLQSNREQTTRGWRCPDNNELARYVGQQLDSEQRKKFEAHVAGCNPCLQTISFLVASEEWPNATTIPPHLVARARDLARSKPSDVWRWRWGMATAAAACVLIVVSFIVFRSRPEAPPSRELIAQQQPDQPATPPTVSIQTASPAHIPIEKPKPTQTSAPSVRGVTAPSPSLLFPGEGAVLKSDQINFSWKPFDGAVSYEITVVTEEGAQVFSETTDQLQLRKITSPLPPGKYFARVVAHMLDGRTARSGMVKFRVDE